MAYQHLRMIGSPCVILTKPAPRHKFAPRATPDGVLLGYVFLMVATTPACTGCGCRLQAVSSLWWTSKYWSLFPFLRTPQVPRQQRTSDSANPEDLALMAREFAASSPVLVPSAAPPVPPVPRLVVLLGVAKGLQPQVHLSLHLLLLLCLMILHPSPVQSHLILLIPEGFFCTRSC